MPSAIVIGGTAGVGRATVTALRGRGYRVGVVARGKDRLAQMQDLDGIETAAADAGDAAALDAAVDALVERLGTPTVWVNCAMATSFSPFMEMGAEEFDRIVRTTFMGQVNGTRAALRLMSRGNIVNIGSGLSYRAVPLQSAYVAAKHAINGFTSAVRSEVIREGRPIELSLIQLPAINTPQFDWARSRLDKQPQPAPPIFAPEVAARAVLKAIDTDAREIVVGRSVLQLLFGQFALPDMIDHRMATSGVTAQHSERPAPGMQEGNLFEPVDHPPTAEGSYGHRAESDGLILDADQTRKAAFFGLPLLGAAAALALGWTLGSRRARPRRLR